MGLITKEVEVVWHPNTIKYYENLNYLIPKYIDKYGKSRFIKGAKIIVRVEDLPKGSNEKVDVECDCCGERLKHMSWQTYLKNVKEDGKYYCRSCAVKSSKRIEELRKSRVKNGKSLEQWFIENNRKDILDRWDYELNNRKPNEISYNTTLKFYFKCPRGIHKSELKSVRMIVCNKQVDIKCIKCNSFAYWGLNNIGKDFLEKYWDYEKNNTDPWEISYSNTKIIYIKCQEKDYHGSYETNSRNFVNNSRCPYCHNSHGKVHKYDSLGYLYPEVLKIWSNKNAKSPYEYSPFSQQYVWWKCPENKHEDYYRHIDSSNIKNFRCPNCQSSKGEIQIDKILTEINISHDSQYIFNDLLSDLGNPLRFDVPIFWDKEKTKLKILIEYDGEQHFRWIPGMMTKEQFKKLQYHDIKKNLYCAENNIQLVRIPYWDYDNIEEILRYYLIENSEFDY